MGTKDNWFDKLLMKKRFYIIITLLFIGVFAYIFKWQHILRFLMMNTSLIMNFLVLMEISSVASSEQYLRL